MVGYVVTEEDTPPEKKERRKKKVTAPPPHSVVCVAACSLVVQSTSPDRKRPGFDSQQIVALPTEQFLLQVTWFRYTGIESWASNMMSG